MTRADAFAASCATRLSGAVAPLARALAPHCHPDLLSASRAVLAVPVAWALTHGWPASVALALYGLAWLTDLLDGALARERRHLGLACDPDRGELIDTVSDKVLLLIVMGTLVMASPDGGGGKALAAVLLAIAAGEAYLLGKRLVDFRAGTRAYAPMPLGKVKVALQAIATALLIAGHLGPWPCPTWIGAGLLLATLPLVIASIVAKHRRAA